MALSVLSGRHAGRASLGGPSAETQRHSHIGTREVKALPRRRQHYARDCDESATLQASGPPLSRHRQVSDGGPTHSRWERSKSDAWLAPGVSDGGAVAPQAPLHPRRRCHRTISELELAGDVVSGRHDHAAPDLELLLATDRGLQEVAGPGVDEPVASKGSLGAVSVAALKSAPRWSAADRRHGGSPIAG
jgi:hypothetical protein